MSYLPIKETLYALRGYYNNAEDVEKIIISSALVAATADGISSFFPVVSIPATVIGCFGAIWTMYAAICKKLNISLKENALKLLARAALTNLAMNAATFVGLFGIGLFFPGASIVTSAILSFVVVYLGGLMFLRMILKMAQHSKNPHSLDDISESEMEQIMKTETIRKEDMKAAKKAFDTNHH